MKLVKEFKEFAMRGNVIDMAVGIIIGVAFGAIVSSLVIDLVFILPDRYHYWSSFWKDCFLSCKRYYHASNRISYWRKRFYRFEIHS